MPQNSLNIESKFNFIGEIEFLLPNQQKVTARRVEIHLLVDSDQQNFEIKAEMSPENWQQVLPYFALQPTPVQRFRLKAAVLERILPEVQAAPTAEALLRAGTGAALCLENYDLVGMSGWFDDVA